MLMINLSTPDAVKAMNVPPPSGDTKGKTGKEPIWLACCVLAQYTAEPAGDVRATKTHTHTPSRAPGHKQTTTCHNHKSRRICTKRRQQQQQQPCRQWMNIRTDLEYISS